MPMRPGDCQRATAQKQRIILVEGIDDALVVDTICEQEALRDSVQILCYSQAGTLGDFLNVLVRDSGFERVARIGLTRDADQDAAQALQSLRTAWERARTVLQSIERPEPQCDLFVVPDNHNDGRLENLCLRSATYPRVLNCAEELYACTQPVVAYPIDREKSLVAAYLSMMEGTG